MYTDLIASRYNAIEVIWLKIVLEDIKLVKLEETPIKCDNQ